MLYEVELDFDDEHYNHVYFDVEAENLEDAIKKAEETIDFKDNKLLGYRIFIDGNPGVLFEKVIKEKEKYDDVECTFCGDGGCINCRPHWFL